MGGVTPFRHDTGERGNRPSNALARPREQQIDREYPFGLSDQLYLQRLAYGNGRTPKNIMMLTADAFGVMPPIARLPPAQAM